MDAEETLAARLAAGEVVDEHSLVDTDTTDAEQKKTRHRERRNPETDCHNFAFTKSLRTRPVHRVDYLAEQEVFGCFHRPALAFLYALISLI